MNTLINNVFDLIFSEDSLRRNCSYKTIKSINELNIKTKNMAFKMIKELINKLKVIDNESIEEQKRLGIDGIDESTLKATDSLKVRKISCMQ